MSRATCAAAGGACHALLTAPALPLLPPCSALIDAVVNTTELLEQYPGAPVVCLTVGGGYR